MPRKHTVISERLQNDMKGGVSMRKTLICLLLSLVLVLSTTTAAFAVGNVGLRPVKKPPVIVRPLVDDMGG